MHLMSFHSGRKGNRRFMNSADNKFDDFPFSLFESANDFSSLAYVREVETEKGVGFAVCAADGTQLAIFNSRDAAYFAAKQHDLEPVYLH